VVGATGGGGISFGEYEFRSEGGESWVEKSVGRVSTFLQWLKMRWSRLERTRGVFSLSIEDDDSGIEQ